MSSWPGVIQFGTFFSVALSDSRCIIASGTSSWCNSFSMLSIHLVFLFQNCFASFASSFWCVLVHFSTECSLNFHWSLFLLLEFISVFSKSAFFRRYLLIYLFKLHGQSYLLVFFLSNLCVFFFPQHIRFVLQFLYVSFLSNFPF